MFTTLPLDTAVPLPAGAAEPGSLVAALRHQARLRAHHTALIFLADGEAESARLSYAELDRRARAFAAHLQQLGLAERHVLLMLPSGVHYVVAFLGSLYAGAVPVPGYAPGNSTHAQRMAHIAADCHAAAVVVAAPEGAAAAHPRLQEFMQAQPGCRVLVVDDDGLLPGGPGEATWVPTRLQPASIAYLQYTSGSTSQPRGVVVTHGNLLAHAEGWATQPGLGRDDVFVTWLPLFHDMGLILGLLQMLHSGGTVVLMPPLAFVQKPLRWLAAISRYRGTASYAPNFAYELCATSTDLETLATLELSCWAVAGNGAEPVKADTIARFAQRFAPCGYRPQAMNPGYGLAEATLTVTRQPRLQPVRPREVDAESLTQGRLVPPREGHARRTLVGCGQAWPGARAVIADARTLQACPEGTVGEIWVDGPVVTQGYWQRAEQTSDTFGAHLASGEGPFMRTGDLGAWLDGQLYVTGRIKDLIVIRGQNHYPQDIEHTVQSAHGALQPGHGAAFSVEVAHEERLVVMQEVRRTHRRSIDAAQVVQAIRTAVAQVHGLQVHAVHLLPPASVPMTSSGKIQRQACRQAHLHGGVESLHSWSQDGGATTSAAPAPAHAPAALSQHDLATWLTERVAAMRHIPPREVSSDEAFTTLGLDSLEHVALSGELSARLGRSVEPTLLYKHPSISALVAHLCGVAPAGTPPLHEPAPAPAEAIAVVGIACRFPKADSVQAFWRVLDEGVDAITEIPASRWPTEGFYDSGSAVSGKSCSRWGGFVEGIDQFDAHFFGISPREAVGMDPQQRLLLHTAWHALEDAGIRPDALTGSDTGVFIGAMTRDYELLQVTQRAPLDAYFGTGSQSSILANRLSYLWGLQGPSWVVETGCSSSLVALHQARGSLLAGECSLAIVGGVNALLAPELFVALSQAQMLSPDGRCRTFDADANGYVRSEGCAVLVLKRHSDALRDNDRVLGLLKGSAVNQDGKSNGLTAPNGLAQQAVILRALASAGVSPQQVSLVEAHGTGTSLGDPIEVDAIAHTYGVASATQPTLWMGSVKSNIGHTEPVAGLAGVIKVLLALQHERIPQTLHVRRLNPHIRIEGSRCAVATEAQPWPRTERPRLAGVSSFGFGGANAHVVLQEAPRPVASEAALDATLPPRVELLTLSAKSGPALQACARRYASFLTSDDSPSLRTVCHTANAHRSPMLHRVGFVAESKPELARALQRFADGEPAALSGQVFAGTQHKTAFLFTGQGSQYPAMGRGLYNRQRVFRRTLDRCDEILRPWLGVSLTQSLYGDDPAAFDLHNTACAQPALFAVEYALAEMWRSWGLRPDALLGHSLGEYVAACVAGVFSLEDGLGLVVQRGRLMDVQTALGTMVAVSAPDATLSQLVCEFASGDHAEVAIAARNTTESLVLSGAPGAVQQVLQRWAAHGVVSTQLQVTRAFHSPLMDEMLQDFQACVQQVCLSPPSIPLVSNLTGRVVGDEVTDPQYWVEHVRKPVEFLAGMRNLDELGCRVFVEMGPHPVLSGLGRQTVEGGLWLPSLRRGADDETQLAHSVAAWSVNGGAMEWSRWARDRWLHEDAAPPQPARLPGYPFQTESYWFKPGAAAPAVVASITTAPFANAGETGGGTDRHRLFGVDTRTLSGVLNALLGAAHAVASEPAPAWTLSDLVVHTPALWSTHAVVELQTRAGTDGRGTHVALHAPHPGGDAGDEGEWSPCATARALGGDHTLGAPAVVRRAWLEHLVERPIVSFHTLCQDHGLSFGAGAQALQRVWWAGAESLAFVDFSGRLGDDTSQRLNVAALDACLHAAAPFIADVIQRGGQWLGPAGCDRVEWHGPLPARAWVYCRWHGESRPGVFGADIEITDESETPWLVLRGLQLASRASTVAVSVPADEAPLTAPCPLVLAAMAPADARARLLIYLQGIASRVLRLSAGQAQGLTAVFEKTALSQLGFDSLMAVEMRKRIQAELGADVALKHFLVGTTGAELAAQIHRIVTVQQLSAGSAAHGTADVVEELVL